MPEGTIEGSAEEVGAEVVPAETRTLFRTQDPAEVVERATEAANALRGVLTNQKLTNRISGREHVKVEGWTTLGSMIGVFPVCEWTRETPDGYLARVVARTLDGRVIGAAEAECTRSEKRWGDADPYAIRSMAQTRATSKALRAPLGFIVTLAGYEATPDEEIPREEREGPTFGPEYTGDKMPEALARLLDGDAASIFTNWLGGEAGYVPAIVARSVLKLASLAEPKDADEADEPQDLPAG
jgi:hypothetical protein